MDKVQLEKDLNAAIDEYMQNTKFECDTFDGDEKTKELVYQISKQTFYALDRFIEALRKHL